MSNDYKLVMVAILTPFVIVLGLAAYFILHNGRDVLLIGMVCIFNVVGVILMFGHGLWIIDGLNVMPIEEKDKYDSERIGKIIGLAFISTAVSILLVFYFGAPVIIILIVTIVFPLVIVAYLFKKYGPSQIP
ncbi:MAG: DUF3784 domain-containing protein [Candidatus Methanoplasma sp.]|jgi:hypothetical protein|nr:DUF3784 domain-containing protein [Candidatus Methanoplasma sp.]